MANPSFERKITRDMARWKSTGLCKRKALVIKGMRQIGKTFIVKEFANENYESVVYIDFKKSKSIRAIFEDDLDVNKIIVDISAALPGVRFIPGSTVLIFDEVQECPGARSSIKSFVDDGRFDIICTGSLLGIRGYNKTNEQGVPIGFEHTLLMKSMDFEEFLWAKGVSKEVVSELRRCFSELSPVSRTIHESMLRYFKEYICVGGLPYVVDTFVRTSDMNAVYDAQHDLIEGYRDDFGKYLDRSGNERIDVKLFERINAIFRSIPQQLDKENKKFQYSLLSHNGRASEYMSAIQWLVDSDLVSLCHNVSILQLPLEGNKIEGCFKIFMQDSGLFISMLERGSVSDILSGRMGIYKGAVFENIIADCFSKMGRSLYYYRKDNGTEIDFVMRYRGELCLIEVKSTTGNTKSSNYILDHPEKYRVNKCIKLGECNVGAYKNKITVPFYLAFLLEEDE